MTVWARREYTDVAELRGPRTVPNIAVDERDGMYILLHPERASYLVTNQAGLRAYRLADGSRTSAEILDRLSEEIDVPLPQLELPIRTFFREVALSGFLQRPGHARMSDLAAPSDQRERAMEKTPAAGLAVTPCGAGPLRRD